MSLKPQPVNIVLANGIDTKTNSKLVEGKLLEMENCEINNQQIVKSPGNIALAQQQTALSVIQDQKGIATAYNTMIVADNNALYKYNSDQDVLNQIDNACFSANVEYNVAQNISEVQQINGTLVNQLYAPYSTLGAPFPPDYCVPQPITAQYGVYLFTMIFQVTGADSSGKVGNYLITLYNTEQQTALYQATFPVSYMSRNELPQDAIGTPVGIFMYTIDVNTGKTYEYYMSYDLSIINMTPSNPASSDIFLPTAVLTTTRAVINTLTNYCSFLSVEYSEGYLYFAFRVVTSLTYAGYIAVRDLNFSTVLMPSPVTTGLVLTTSQESLNLCTTVFYHPVTKLNYFVANFGPRYYFFAVPVLSAFVALSFQDLTITGYSTHSLGFLESTQEIVLLVHDIREFDGTTLLSNRISPTVNKYQLTQVGGGFLLLDTPTLTGANADPRWTPGSWGTSAIAGRIMCVYDKILFPIFYFAYLSGSDMPIIYQTPTNQRRSSAHLVQFIPEITFSGPMFGLLNTLNHVSFIKDYSCSLFNMTSGSFTYSAPPSIAKSKLTFVDADTQASNCFYGFFVQTQGVSFSDQNVFIHQFNAYNVTIPEQIDFQGFPRSAFYFGSGKAYELTQTTMSEMGFFDFPQISIGNAPTGTIIKAGAYLYSAFYQWTNGDGEFVRSNSFDVLYNLLADAASINVFVTPPPFFSNKLNSVVRIFRSTQNGTVPYFEVNLQNGTTLPMYTDTTVDPVAPAVNHNEVVYTYGGVLGDFPFPSVLSFTLFKDCIFAIDANDNNRIWFTKPRQQGYALAATDVSYFQVETKDGGCTFLANMDDKLIIFKANSLYFVENDVPDAAGNSGTLTIPQKITAPVGCSQPLSVVEFPNGIIFKSKKGLWQLSRALESKYIGADVEAYNNLTITSAQLLTDKNKVKFLTLEGTVLVYDYYYSTWNIETHANSFVDSTIFSDSLIMLGSEGEILQEDNDIFLRQQQNYTAKFTTGWVKLAGLSGFQRVYRILFTGDYKGAHILKCSLYYDYANEPLEFHYFNPTQNLGIYNAYGNYNWGTVEPYAGYADSNYLFRINPREQKCTSIKITIEDVFTGLSNQTGASFTATNLLFDCAVKALDAKVGARLQT